MERYCKALNENGEPCRQRPFVGRELCFWHDPEFEKEREEARRAGGVNRRREQTLKAVYELFRVSTIEDLQRLLEIGGLGLLALENSVQRNRAIISLVGAGAKLIEVGELAAKLESIRSVLEPRQPAGDSKKGWWRR